MDQKKLVQKILKAANYINNQVRKAPGNYIMLTPDNIRLLNEQQRLMILEEKMKIRRQKINKIFDEKINN